MSTDKQTPPDWVLIEAAKQAGWTGIYTAAELKLRYRDAEKYTAGPCFRALCRAIEQHEAFRQDVRQRAKKVLDVAQTANSYANAREAIECELSSLVIAKSDPLVDYLINAEGYFPTVAKKVADGLRSKFEIKEKQ